MTPTDAIREVFGGRFDGDSWAAWRAFWSVAFGEAPENDVAKAIARRCTGRTGVADVPSTRGVAGDRPTRRQGASARAHRGLPRACFRRHLAPGERGTVLIIAADSKQARVIFRYIAGLLTHMPMLAAMIERETPRAST